MRRYFSSFSLTGWDKTYIGLLGVCIYFILPHLNFLIQIVLIIQYYFYFNFIIYSSCWGFLDLYAVWQEMLKDLETKVQGGQVSYS